MLAAGSGDTVVSGAFTGLPVRAIRDRFTEDYADTPVLPPMLQSGAAESAGLIGGAPPRERSFAG